MVAERLPPDTPGEWLNRAGSDLAIARASIPGAYLEDLCYHSQQAVEKALKAVLLHRTTRFPYVHDLAELAECVRKSGLDVPPVVLDAVGLTAFAVQGRYPGPDEPVSTHVWRASVAKAEAVMRRAAGIVAGTP